ncbi:hypothetical protein RchiOBHm_Chr5g0005861 [Rosa chinensis]|uniref:Uncharacterized protein n=1 Tax=Rosa chinensis TaxID=74649 RepID=A0A2P6Q3F3_ROSCH|nr:hypothetical protein RchiOBHm_Chr5g0005861 [Rosa chinensis]
MSLFVINCIKRTCEFPWKLKYLIVIKMLASSFSHIFWEANFLADAVTSCGYNLHSLMIRINSVSTTMVLALNLDMQNFSCPRGFSL